MAINRELIVKQAEAWLGCKESNGTHKPIIDVYNNHKPLARGYKVKYTDEWCATFASACAIACGATSFIPTECSCSKLLDLFKSKGCWQEADDYTPSAGDYIFYDWEDNGKGDNKGQPNHVGIVQKVSGKKIYVIEGNYNMAVKVRTITVNGKYIRGYGCPKYTSAKKSNTEVAREVIAGKWGNGTARKKALKAAGYNPTAIQKLVNEMVKK